MYNRSLRMEEKEIIKSVLKEQKKQMPFGLMAV